MGWDQSREVPWARLVREWLLYVGVMFIIFLLIFREGDMTGAITGLLISGPLYIGFGAIMAKFGFRRRTRAEMRGPREGANDGDDADDPEEGDRLAPTLRERPPATRRTSPGDNVQKRRPRRR